MNRLGRHPLTLGCCGCVSLRAEYETVKSKAKGMHLAEIEPKSFS